MPRTVSIQDGSPSFLRSDATWTSIVFALPYQVVCHTSWRISARGDDRAGLAGEQREQVELLRRQLELATVELSPAAADVELERPVRAAAACRPLGAGAGHRPDARESSRNPNGLTM